MFKAVCPSDPKNKTVYLRLREINGQFCVECSTTENFASAINTIMKFVPGTGGKLRAWKIGAISGSTFDIETDANGYIIIENGY